MTTRVSAAGGAPESDPASGQTIELAEETTLVLVPAAKDPPPSVDEIVDRLVKQVRHTFGNRITPGNIARLVSEAMETCETFNVASGPKKKDIVIAAVSRILEETVDDETLRSAASLVLPSIIDTLISAYKKQVDFGGETDEESVKKWRWRCC